jgi:hypothetical protein
MSKVLNSDAFKASNNTAIVTLTITNLDLFADSILFCFGGLAPEIKEIFINEKYVIKSGPSWKEPVAIEGFPADQYLWAEVQSDGTLKPKLDMASIESLKKAIKDFKSLQTASLLLENFVLREIVNRISPTSMAQIRAFAGAKFNDDRLSLPKFWKLIKDSHAKANTTTMIETLYNVINLSMSQDEDFYEYAQRSSESFKSFNSVYKLYLELPLKTFVDLLMSLCTIGGLNKNNNVFDTAIHDIRQMDLGTPSATPIFESIMALLTKAHHTRTLLVNKPSLQGLSSTIDVPSTPPVALMSEIIDSCKKCKKSMPRVIDKNTNDPQPYCRPCYNDVIAAKKVARLAVKNSARSSASTIKPKSVLINPKVANSNNFAGSNPKLSASSAVMSDSQRFLIDNGFNDNFEFNNNNENSDDE